MRRYDLTPNTLKLEVLETAFLGKEADRIAATIRRLADIGVVCALDDFGTGYASLTHLRQFDVRRLKIDRSFVSGLDDNHHDHAIVQTLVGLGKALGIRVTAEGVETAGQLAILRAMGCDCAQGYLIARPMPAEAVPGFLTRWYGGRPPGCSVRAAARRSNGTASPPRTSSTPDHGASLRRQQVAAAPWTGNEATR